MILENCHIILPALIVVCFSIAKPIHGWDCGLCETGPDFEQPVGEI